MASVCSRAVRRARAAVAGRASAERKGAVDVTGVDDHHVRPLEGRGRLRRHLPGVGPLPEGTGRVGDEHVGPFHGAGVDGADAVHHRHRRRAQRRPARRPPDPASALPTAAVRRPPLCRASPRAPGRLERCLPSDSPAPWRGRPPRRPRRPPVVRRGGRAPPPQSHSRSPPRRHRRHRRRWPAPGSPRPTWRSPRRPPGRADTVRTLIVATAPVRTIRSRLGRWPWRTSSQLRWGHTEHDHLRRRLGGRDARRLPPGAGPERGAKRHDGRQDDEPDAHRRRREPGPEGADDIGALGGAMGEAPAPWPAWRCSMTTGTSVTRAPSRTASTLSAVSSPKRGSRCTRRSSSARTARCPESGAVGRQPWPGPPPGREIAHPRRSHPVRLPRAGHRRSCRRCRRGPGAGASAPRRRWCPRRRPRAGTHRGVRGSADACGHRPSLAASAAGAARSLQRREPRPPSHPASRRRPRGRGRPRPLPTGQPPSPRPCRPRSGRRRRRPLPALVGRHSRRRLGADAAELGRPHGPLQAGADPQARTPPTPTVRAAPARDAEGREVDDDPSREVRRRREQAAPARGRRRQAGVGGCGATAGGGGRPRRPAWRRNGRRPRTTTRPPPVLNENYQSMSAEPATVTPTFTNVGCAYRWRHRRRNRKLQPRPPQESEGHRPPPPGRRDGRRRRPGPPPPSGAGRGGPGRPSRP